MTEQYTYTGSRLAKEVKDSFGDTGNVQLTDEMLLRWINDGQRQIDLDSDYARSQSTVPLIQGQATYDLGVLFNALRMKQVEAVVISGKRLTLVPFAQYLELIEARRDVTTGTPDIGMLRSNMLTLFPTPPATVANAITVYFTQYAADLQSLAEKLGVPDRYYTPLRDWVLAQAYQMNDDLEGSQLKLQHAQAGIQSQYEREHIAPVDLYPIVPDSEWA